MKWTSSFLMFQAKFKAEKTSPLAFVTFIRPNWKKVFGAFWNFCECEKNRFWNISFYFMFLQKRFFFNCNLKVSVKISYHNESNQKFWHHTFYVFMSSNFRHSCHKKGRISYHNESNQKSWLYTFLSSNVLMKTHCEQKKMT